MKYSNVIFSILDGLKLFSDDSVWEQEHIVFMMHKYRSMLIKQRFFDKKREIPFEFYQSIDIKIDTSVSNNGFFKSKIKIPAIIDNGLVHNTTFVRSLDSAGAPLNLVNNSRFDYIGFNKYTNNQVYVTISTDGYVCIKDLFQNRTENSVVVVGDNNSTDDYTLLTHDGADNLSLSFLRNSNLTLTSIFDNPLECYTINGLDAVEIVKYNVEFPCDNATTQVIVELVTKEIMGLNQIKRDDSNNANDDSSLIQYKK